jgi:hypothetical protein
VEPQRASDAANAPGLLDECMHESALEELLDAAPVQVGAGRQHAHQAWCDALNRIEQLDAAKTRPHVEIAHDGTEIGPGPNQIESLGAVGGQDDFVAAGSKLAGDGAPHEIVVIDDKDGGTIAGVRVVVRDGHYPKYKAIIVPTDPDRPGFVTPGFPLVPPHRGFDGLGRP